MKNFILIFGLTLFSACADGGLEEINVKQPIEPKVETAARQTMQSNEKIETEQIKDEKIKRKKTNLSTQPREIQLAVGAHNLFGDVNNAEDMKYIRYIKIDVESRDLNHDGIAERIVIVTEDQEAGINEDLQPVYVFAKEKGKWKYLNENAEIMREGLKFAAANRKGEFDDIEFKWGASVTDEQGKRQVIDFISVNRYENGAYREAECRRFPTGEIIPCPKRT